MSAFFYSTKERGFTLLELLLYIAVSSVVLGVVASFYSTLITARIKHQTITEVEQQGEQALRLITQALRNAESITSPGGGSSGDTLVLDMYDSVDDPTTFDLSSGSMRACRGSGCTATAITGSTVTVSGVTFQNLSRASTPGVVRITFTLNRSTTSGRNEYDYSKTFYASASLRQP